MWEASSKHKANTSLCAVVKVPKVIRPSSCMTHTTRERLCVRKPRHKPQRQKPQAGYHSPAGKHSLQSSCLRRGTPNHLPKPRIMPQNRYSRDFPHCKANSVINTDDHEKELANEKSRKKLCRNYTSNSEKKLSNPKGNTLRIVTVLL